jgi:hypothetical protein
MIKEEECYNYGSVNTELFFLGDNIRKILFVGYLIKNNFSDAI